MRLAYGDILHSCLQIVNTSVGNFQNLLPVNPPYNSTVRSWLSAKGSTVGWLGLGLALAGFLWYVWPTPWSHYTVRGRHAETEHYRVNRFTGDTEVLTRQGWK